MIKAQRKSVEMGDFCAIERAGLCFLGLICPVAGIVRQCRMPRAVPAFLVAAQFLGLSIYKTKVRSLKCTLCLRLGVEKFQC